MNTRLGINIGLLGFIALLSIIIINSGKDTTQQLARLSNIDQSEILQIKVLRRDLDDFEFNKQNEIWRINAPLQYRANIARINAMLRILNVESFSQLNTDEVDLEQLGLAEPVIVMRLNDHEFKFGNTDAIDQRRYVLFNGKIHLINDSLYQQLMTNAAFFADPRLIPENFKISSIEFPENKIELIDSQWKLHSQLDISPDQLKRIVFSWENVSAISAEPMQLSDTESIIKISSTDSQSIQFFIVSTEPHLILGRKDLGIQFHMGSDESDKLFLHKNNENNDSASDELQLNRISDSPR